MLALAAAAVAPWLVPGLMSVAALGAACAAGIAALGFVRAGWFGPRRIERLAWLSDGRWHLIDARGRCVESRLDRATRVGPGLVWLRWRAGRRSMLLARGDLRQLDLRRLTVRLRLAGTDPLLTLATRGAPVR